MAVPCWEWFNFSDDACSLEASCEHGNRLTPDGDKCDSLIVYLPEGTLLLGERCGKLPVRTRLWNNECGCQVDVYIEKDRRVYWLSELCVRERKE